MSKHLKKLKNIHKQLLTKNSYNAKKYLYERDTLEEIIFINVETKGRLRFSKREGIFSTCQIH